MYFQQKRDYEERYNQTEYLPCFIADSQFKPVSLLRPLVSLPVFDLMWGFFITRRVKADS